MRVTVCECKREREKEREREYHYASFLFMTPLHGGTGFHMRRSDVRVFLFQRVFLEREENTL